LPAKDIIDLQLGVRSLDEAQRIAPALAAAGFVLVPGREQDTPHPAGSDPAPWRKAFHANADPGRRAHLHIRVAGATAWAFALQFRDWLRSDAAARDEYVAVKRRVSAEFGTTTAGYATAKEPWFDGAWDACASWAAATGWRPPAFG
jgi:dephospho-CoA kinase